MAFGKQRPNMNLRQRGKRSQQRVKRKGGGAPYFRNKYQPPLGVSTDVIRLVPCKIKVPLISNEGELLLDENGQQAYDISPYLNYKSHFHGGRKKSCICSAGPLGDIKGKADPCEGCDWFWWEWDQRQASGQDKPNAMSRRDMWAFSVLVMADFHQMPDLDEHGNVKKNDKTGKAYYNWEKCAGRGCDGCAQGVKTKKGHRQHWSLGLAHFNTLLDYSLEVGAHCRICSQEDCITSLAWVCQNQECGEAVIDMSTTTLKDEEIDKLTSYTTTCPNCKVEGFLAEVFECSNCQKAGREGDRATMFDVDLTVKRVEASDGGNQNILQITRSTAPKPIDSDFEEELRKPLALDKIFQPTELKRQIDMFDKAPERGEPSGQRTPVNSASQGA
jgi:hypothetical protein